MNRTLDMHRAKVTLPLAIILLTFTFLFVPYTFAYGGDGNLTLAQPPPPTSGVCNDGNDNDGDGLTDENDMGCTKPYYLDRSEYDMRDNDLSYNLYDDTAPNSDDLTLFVPGSTKRNFVLKAIDESKVPKTNQNEIYESYLDQYGYPQWAGGNQKWNLLSVGGAVSVDPGFRNGQAIATQPVSLEFLFEESGVRTCGNGDREMAEGNNFGCPQDFGFPDQLDTSSGTRTENKVSTDISSELGDFEADVGIDHDGDGDSLQSDNPDYTMDFVGKEPNGTIEWDITGIKGNKEDPIQPSIPIDSEIQNAPDFYGDGRNLYKIYPYAEESNNLGTVYDYDIEKEDDIKGYFKDGDNETYQNGCENVGENMTCVDKDRKCTSVDSNQVDNYTINRDDQVTISVDTYRYEIKNNDGEEKEWEDPGYQNDITDQNLEIVITRDLLTGNNKQDAPNCDGWSGKECALQPGESSGGSCDPTFTEEDVYEQREIEVDNLGSGEAYTEKASGSVSATYEKINIEDQKIFSTIYSDNDEDEVESEISSKEGLFGSDYSPSQMSRIIHKDQFYSYEQNIPTEDFSNSPAFSASSFKIVVQDNKFHSKRDYYGVWNVDGTNGFGDSFVAIKEGTIESKPDPFLNETRIISGDGSNPGYIEADGGVDFVTPGDYSQPSDCPGDSIFCVSAADVTVKSWDDWSSGNTPEFEIETIDTVNVSESWGACRKYQELIGGAKESILRCQHDWDNDFPSGPTPFWEPPVVGGEN